LTQRSLRCWAPARCGGEASKGQLDQAGRGKCGLRFSKYNFELIWRCTTTLLDFQAKIAASRHLKGNCGPHELILSFVKESAKMFLKGVRERESAKIIIIEIIREFFLDMIQ
jgi:hypothetical protein